MSLKSTSYTIHHPNVGSIFENSNNAHDANKLTDSDVCEDFHPQTVTNLNSLVIQLSKTIEQQKIELQKKNYKISKLETVISNITDISFQYKPYIHNTNYDSSEFEKSIIDIPENQNYTYTETVKVQIPNENYDDNNDDNNKFITYEELIQVYDTSEKL